MSDLSSYKLIGTINKNAMRHILGLLNEPAHEIMVLTTQATSEGSGEPVHPRSLARAFALNTH